MHGILTRCAACMYEWEHGAFGAKANNTPLYDTPTLGCIRAYPHNAFQNQDLSFSVKIGHNTFIRVNMF